MSYISDQLLTTNLVLQSQELNKNIDNTIRLKLKKNKEGRCSDVGYIIKDSINIIHKTMGKLEVYDNISSIKYKVTYKAKIIKPSEGDIIETYINNINKMGVISYIKLSSTDTSEDSPIIIMIPKDYFKNSIHNIDDLIIGQKLMIKVVGCRIKYKSKTIQVIAQPEK
ncbi:MAG: hypothetical protein CMH79_04255 [Nitrospinae bacterium]|nr:hypothetical protein [Nitrospinota bacterium]|tara:strand:- start:418 stop:921 length:504 start_codon:yes stop_codon:yes gene_type:complete